MHFSSKFHHFHIAFTHNTLNEFISRLVSSFIVSTLKATNTSFEISTFHGPFEERSKTILKIDPAYIMYIYFLLFVNAPPEVEFWDLLYTSYLLNAFFLKGLV